MYLFEPPTHEEPMRTDTEWLRYYRLTYANSVYKDHDTGQWISRRTPPPTVTETYTNGVDYFRGGCRYLVDDTLAAELNAAGFPTFQAPSPTPPDDAKGYGRGAFGSGPYGE